jgi:hypothetical protein
VGQIARLKTSEDYAIFKYSSSGAQLAYTVHDGAGYPDAVIDAVLCPDGSVVAVSHSQIANGYVTMQALKFRP